jgi:hypothetical protein
VTLFSTRGISSNMLNSGGFGLDLPIEIFTHEGMNS